MSVQMNKSLRELKELVFAYDLAGEFDHVPYKLTEDEALEILGEGEVPTEVLKKYSGNRQDEISKMLVSKVNQFIALNEILNQKGK